MLVLGMGGDRVRKGPPLPGGKAEGKELVPRGLSRDSARWHWTLESRYANDLLRQLRGGVGRGQSRGARKEGGGLCSHFCKDRAAQPLEGAVLTAQTAGLFLFMEEMKPWAGRNAHLKQPCFSPPCAAGIHPREV